MSLYSTAEVLYISDYIFDKYMTVREYQKMRSSAKPAAASVATYTVRESTLQFLPYVNNIWSMLIHTYISYTHRHVHMFYSV